MLLSEEARKAGFKCRFFVDPKSNNKWSKDLTRFASAHTEQYGSIFLPVLDNTVYLFEQQKNAQAIIADIQKNKLRAVRVERITGIPVWL